MSPLNVYLLVAYFTWASFKSCLRKIRSCRPWLGSLTTTPWIHLTYKTGTSILISPPQDTSDNHAPNSTAKMIWIWNGNCYQFVRDKGFVSLFKEASFAMKKTVFLRLKDIKKPASNPEGFFQLFLHWSLPLRKVFSNWSACNRSLDFDKVSSKQKIITSKLVCHLITISLQQSVPLSL